jgi:predicted membrane protein (TIGR00267 family)
MAAEPTARTTPRTRLGRAVNSPSTSTPAPPAARSTSARHEPHKSQTNWLRDVILGGQDGLVNILGIILGVIAGGGSQTVLIITGVAAAITESISMGAVAYTSSQSERDYYLAQQAREEQEIESTPEEEAEEVREIYASKGFQGGLLDDVVRTITANRDVWLRTMMDEELHLEPVDTARIIRGAVVVTIATLIGHMLPLWPFVFFARTPALIVAILVSALALFGVGVYSAKTLIGDWRIEGVKMVAIGLGAAAIGFVIAHLFQAATG